MGAPKKDDAGYCVRSKGKKSYYYYVRRNSRGSDGVSKASNIISLGNKEKASERLSGWIKDPVSAPDKVKNYGFNEKHYKKWLEYVKSK